MQRVILLIAGILGLLGVTAGTFGAHVLEGRLSAELLDIFHTGLRYHIYHALAILACGWAVHLGAPRRVTAAVVCFTVGVAIFAGSLYTLALTGLRWLGAITPIGGVLFAIGWALLISAAFGARRE